MTLVQLAMSKRVCVGPQGEGTVSTQRQWGEGGGRTSMAMGGLRELKGGVAPYV